MESKLKSTFSFKKQPSAMSKLTLYLLLMELSGQKGGLI